MHYWVKKIRKHADPNVEIIILGNKTDLINSIAVQEEEADELVEMYGVQLYMTCAKDATNVD
jgi:Ras-related protein Rab-11A